VEVDEVEASWPGYLHDTVTRGGRRRQAGTLAHHREDR
jgi:hypothetical protein